MYKSMGFDLPEVPADKITVAETGASNAGVGHRALPYTERVQAMRRG